MATPSTPPTTKPCNKIETLPSEMIAEIISHVPATYLLAVALTSKTLLTHIPLASIDPAHHHLTRQQVTSAHTAIEARTPRRKKLHILTCTLCGHLKPITHFSKAQWKRTNHRRFCIPCGVRSRKYLSRTFTTHVHGLGKKCFACVGCETAKPVEVEYKGSEYVMFHLRKYKILCGAHPSQRWCQDCGNFGVRYGSRRSRVWSYTLGCVGLFHEGREVVFRRGRLCFGHAGSGGKGDGAVLI